ncbi:MAG: orotidine-5'-phosphate decarboxylase [Magnetococcales bacterium]|nr:orotidine-5'-phosphate decarboxylase [Magnetococcales bacterium]
MAPHFTDRLLQRMAQTSAIALGIDPNIDLMPDFLHPAENTPDSVEAALVNFCVLILEAADGLVPAVKFQAAFFEQFGIVGIKALAGAMAASRDMGFLVILDGKRGDIGSTSQAYAHAYLGGGSALASNLEADCITLNPFLGEDAMEPFLRTARERGKGLFILVKTSNPGSSLVMNALTPDGELLSHRLARLVEARSVETLGASGFGLVGAVVGATHPREAAPLRERMPHAVILVPGIGAQGGAIETLRGFAAPGGGGVLVPMSRTLTYPKGAGNDPASYQKSVAAAIRHHADHLRDTLG